MHGLDTARSLDHVRRLCCKSTTRTAAPRCASACARPDSLTSRRPCRTSTTRTAAPRYASACALSQEHSLIWGTVLVSDILTTNVNVWPLAAETPHSFYTRNTKSDNRGINPGLRLRGVPALRELLFRERKPPRRGVVLGLELRRGALKLRVARLQLVLRKPAVRVRALLPARR